MTELPPPTGDPVMSAARRELMADPWAEQARRRERHQAQRRRRRWQIVTGVLVAIVVVGAVGAAAVLVVTEVSFDADDPTGDEPAASSVTSAVGQAAAVPAAPPTAASSDPDTADDVAEPSSAPGIRVTEVWLLDRGDGQFDWGAVLSSTSDVLRADLDVEVAAVDADGVEVFAEQMVLPQLGSSSDAVVGGVFDGVAGTPVRVEVEVAPGSAELGASELVFSVIDVRRLRTGQVSSDDRLVGTVQLVVEGDPDTGSTDDTGGTVDGVDRADAVGVPVGLAVLWRDEDGQVVASVFDVLDPVDADTATVDFSVRLPRGLVPAGEPDVIVAGAGVVR